MVEEANPAELLAALQLVFGGWRSPSACRGKLRWLSKGIENWRRRSQKSAGRATGQVSGGVAWIQIIAGAVAL